MQFDPKSTFDCFCFGTKVLQASQLSSWALCESLHKTWSAFCLMWTNAPVFLSLVIECGVLARPGSKVGRNAKEDSRILCASGPNTTVCQSKQNRKLKPPHLLGQHESQTFVNISLQKQKQQPKINPKPNYLQFSAAKFQKGKLFGCYAIPSLVDFGFKREKVAKFTHRYNDSRGIIWHALDQNRSLKHLCSQYFRG